MPSKKTKRLTIGILPGWPASEGSTPDRYLTAVFSGIQAKASARGCNLLLAWGVGRVAESSDDVHPAWPVSTPDSDFVPVGPWNTDGLIVLAPLLDEARSAYIQKIIAKGRPVLFIAKGEKGPAIIFNNTEGIYQGIAHLIQHGHRRIAYIAGDPDDPGDSLERYQAYRAAIAEFGLEYDPRLVAYGLHNDEDGYLAMWEILNSKASFTAVQSSDDVSAIGAMRALRAAGYRIPQDVAVIGFDDQTDAVAQVPPLTSVHLPLAEIGAKALDMMLDHLESGARLETTLIPTHLVARQSCGCLPESMFFSASNFAAPDVSAQPEAGFVPGAREIPQSLSAKMAAALPEAERNRQPGAAERRCARLLEAFVESITRGESGAFARCMSLILQELEQADADINAYQEVVSALRQQLHHTTFHWLDPGRLPFVEDLLHQARVAISESVQRIDVRHKYFLDSLAYRLSILTSRLNASLDNHQTIKILEDHLGELGIRHARVALFEPKEGDPVAVSRIISSDPDFKAPYLEFFSCKFPPRGLYPPGERLSLVLLPLVFQNEPLGYVAFDAGDLTAVGTLALQLAANLKAARLHTEVVELSIQDSLTEIYNRRFLELFLKKEVDRCHRYQRGLAVIMLDIDHFKQYNDTHGHPAGDIVLQQIARSLQNRQRKLDIVARYGGDEFAVILPETDEGGAVKVADTLRLMVAEQFEATHHLTLSLGVTAMAADEYSAEEMILNADRALYEAKLVKNKVCVYRGR